MAPEKKQAYLDGTSTIIIQNRTLEKFKEIVSYMSQKDIDKGDKFTFDGLLADMTRICFKCKHMDWLDDDD